MEQLVLDIWSDVICPWCYLGHVRLEEAIEMTELGDEVSLRRRAFQLDPRATSTPGDLRQAMAVDPKFAEIGKEIRARTQQVLLKPSAYEGARH